MAKKQTIVAESSERLSGRNLFSLGGIGRDAMCQLFWKKIVLDERPMNGCVQKSMHTKARNKLSTISEEGQL